MKAIYAFYSKPFGSIDIRKASTHWSIPYIEFLVLAYSVSKSKSFGFETVLFCDDYGKKLIVDEFGIEFDIVKVELNDIERDPKFWAAGKIYAYTKGINSLGGFEPFVFFDNDAGFHEKPPEHFFESKFRCQHIHHDAGTVFENQLKKLVKETKNEYPFEIYHECSKRIEGLKGANAGMVFIGDEKLWSEYTRYAWDLIDHPFFDKIASESKKSKFRAISLWNVTVEENLLFLLSRKLNLEQPQTIFEFQGLKVPKDTYNPTKYFHIWGSKNDKDFLKRYEKIAVDFIPKKNSERVYNYFK